MIEIFSHDVSVRVDEDTQNVFVISGKGWEDEPFELYVGIEEAKTILWQLSFFVEDQ